MIKRAECLNLCNDTENQIDLLANYVIQKKNYTKNLINYTKHLIRVEYPTYYKNAISIGVLQPKHATYTAPTYKTLIAVNHSYGLIASEKNVELKQLSKTTNLVLGDTIVLKKQTFDSKDNAYLKTIALLSYEEENGENIFERNTTQHEAACERFVETPLKVLFIKVKTFGSKVLLIDKNEEWVCLVDLGIIGPFFHTNKNELSEKLIW